MSVPAREAVEEYSRGRRVLRVLQDLGRSPLTAMPALAIAGAVLLLVAEFLPVIQLVVGSLETVQAEKSGHANHAWALVPIALLTVPMALGAARGATPAAVAVVILGIAALAVALAIDLPAARQSGTFELADAYEDARARPGSGFYVETLGAVLVLVSGGLTLLLRRQAGDRGDAAA